MTRLCPIETSRAVFPGDMEVELRKWGEIGLDGAVDFLTAEVSWKCSWDVLHGELTATHVLEWEL